MCKEPGCASACRKGGVCVKHGGKTKCCKHEGCTNQSKVNHLCFRHGEKKICKHNGCTNIAKCAAGVCTRHVSSVYDYFALYMSRASLIYYDTICTCFSHRDTNAEQLFANMRAAKVALEKVVYALNIHQVGIQSAKLMAVTDMYRAGQVERVVVMHHVLKGKDVVNLKGALTNAKESNSAIVTELRRKHANTVVVQT